MIHACNYFSEFCYNDSLFICTFINLGLLSLLVSLAKSLSAMFIVIKNQLLGGWKDGLVGKSTSEDLGLGAHMVTYNQT